MIKNKDSLVVKPFRLSFKILVGYEKELLVAKTNE